MVSRIEVSRTGHMRGVVEQASSGEPCNTPLQNPIAPLPVVLHAQVDTLYISYTATFAAAMVERLEAVKVQAQALPEGIVAFGAGLVLHAHGSKAYPYHLEQGGRYTIMLAPARLESNVRVRLGSAYLTEVGDWRVAVQAAAAVLAGLVDSIGAGVPSEVHLCADYTGYTLAPDAIDSRLLRRCKAPPNYYHMARGAYETVEFGTRGSPVQATIYRKDVEIRHSHKEYLADIWRAHGWDGVAPVWRMEYRFRREMLRQAGISLVEQLDVAALWAYGMRWCSLRVASADSHRERWPVAPEWQAIEQGALAMFGVPGVRVERTRSGAAQAYKLAAAAGGMLTSIAALTGLRNPGEVLAYVSQVCCQRLAAGGIDWYTAVEHKRLRYGLVEHEAAAA